MYARNSASPEPIAIGPVVQISDGAVQTAGVTVRVKPIGVTEADGGGTTAYSTDGVVLYTPTQAETNYTSFILIAKKTGCIPASVTVVTSARSVTGEVQVGGYASGQVPLQPTTAGRTLDVTATGAAGIDLANVENQGSTLNLSATTIKTATDVETDTQDIQTRLPSGLVDGRMAAIAEVVGDKTGYTLTVTPPTAGTIADAVWDEAYNQHTTAGTFGKLMDILRKANTLIEGTVTSAVTPTAGSFSTDVNYTTGAFNHSIMLFTTGALAEQNSPILTYVNTNGVITVEQAFTAAPQVGDAFVIVPTSHVHSLAAIADQVWDEAIAAHLASGSTGEALNNSGGSGGGTDWTANERTAIRSILGIPASGTTPADPSVGILDTIRDGVNSIGINVYPVTSSTPERVNGTTITVYKDEQTNVTISTTATLTGLTLRFVAEDRTGADILVVENASFVARTATSVTLQIPSSVTDEIASYTWTLRDVTTGNSVLARGVLSVQAAASKNA